MNIQLNVFNILKDFLLNVVLQVLLRWTFYQPFDSSQPLHWLAFWAPNAEMISVKSLTPKLHPVSNSIRHSLRIPLTVSPPSLLLLPFTIHWESLDLIERLSISPKDFRSRRKTLNWERLSQKVLENVLERTFTEVSVFPFNRTHRSHCDRCCNHRSCDHCCVINTARLLLSTIKYYWVLLSTTEWLLLPDKTIVWFMWLLVKWIRDDKRLSVLKSLVNSKKSRIRA